MPKGVRSKTGLGGWGTKVRKETMGTAAYRDLDDAIIAHLEREPWRHPMYVASIWRISEHEVGRDATHGDEKAWRLIDHRLQALKKARRLRYVCEVGLKPQWQVVTPNVGHEQPAEASPSDGMVRRMVEKRKDKLWNR